MALLDRLRATARLQQLAALTGSWLPDLLMVGGASAVSYGAGQVYPPTGWIVAGLFALYAGVATAGSQK